jgi:magnesium chelatase family protein
MLAKINSSALYGVEAFRIKIEVNIANGTGYFITGQPDDAVKESLSRIDVALKSNSYHMPRTKISINLAPANIRKEGTAYDLPIAMGILLASEQEFDLGKLQDFIVIGELGLDGSVYPVRGALCMAYQAKRDGYKGIILPASNAADAALIKEIQVYGVKHLKEVVEFIRCDCALQPKKNHLLTLTQKINSNLDFKDVKGQNQVKRGMEIAAAGGHNTIIIGPPGIGKTMLAKRLPSILPPLTFAEALETTRIHSVVNSGEALTGLITERPFRNPHHTSSDGALAGGGSIPMPGEISLAHNGVLFLDELPEFKRSTIEVLRQPLEERKVFIARAKAAIEYPASFQLIASMNPCLCGYFNHPVRVCTCSKRAIYWYRRKVSGPLFERIDLHIEAESLSMNELIELEPGESSESIRKRVIAARKIQSVRYKDLDDVHCNAQMPDAYIDIFCNIEPHARKFLLKTIDMLQLSVRSYCRILKVSRTIADLKGCDEIELSHVAEAIHLRNLDKPLIIPQHNNQIKKNRKDNTNRLYDRIIKRKIIDHGNNIL